ncbi:ATP-binding protein [Candidatus Sumerlaeota bacterium]|nr:ATP-binding protein [Candidatus Sumerlaeota bacterium]
MIQKPIQSISQSDLSALIENEVCEGLSIEYKERLPTNSDEDKHEFLADVSAFANAVGGDLLYGIREKEGAPTGLLGLSCDIDAEKSRLENILRDCLDPRILGVRMEAIGNFSEGPILLVRIPRSWAAPHMITFRNKSRFYMRNNGGKHLMDVSEIRAAFLQSATIRDRLEDFRARRLQRILSGNAPCGHIGGKKLALHLLPIASFAPGAQIDLSDHEAALQNLPTARTGIANPNSRFNLDGFIAWSKNRDGSIGAYHQIFRTGAVEWVRCYPKQEASEQHQMDEPLMEQTIVDSMIRYLHFLRAFEISHPIEVGVSLIGMGGVRLYLHPLLRDTEVFPIDRDVVTLPEVMLNESIELADRQPLATLMRPAFDALWNACGLPRSQNYNAEGIFVHD